MKHTKLTPHELTAVKETAESVAARYEGGSRPSKLDFLVEVKSLLPEGKNNIKTALAVWNRHYAN